MKRVIVDRMRRQQGQRAVLAATWAFVAGLVLTLGAAGCGSSASAAATATAERGQSLFKAFGCNACHVVSASETEKKVGPPLVGVYGQPVQLSDGREVSIDEAYLRESILQPDAATVEGYPSAVMAAGIARFKEKLEEPGTVDALVEYVKSLK